MCCCWVGFRTFEKYRFHSIFCCSGGPMYPTNDFRCSRWFSHHSMIGKALSDSHNFHLVDCKLLLRYHYWQYYLSIHIQCSIRNAISSEVCMVHISWRDTSYQFLNNVPLALDTHLPDFPWDLCMGFWLYRYAWPPNHTRLFLVSVSRPIQQNSWRQMWTCLWKNRLGRCPLDDPVAVWVTRANGSSRDVSSYSIGSVVGFRVA